MMTYWSQLGNSIRPVFDPEIPGSGNAQSRDFGTENAAGIPESWDSGSSDCSPCFLLSS